MNEGIPGSRSVTIKRNRALGAPISYQPETPPRYVLRLNRQILYSTCMTQIVNCVGEPLVSNIAQNGIKDSDHRNLSPTGSYKCSRLSNNLTIKQPQSRFALSILQAFSRPFKLFAQLLMTSTAETTS